MEARLVAGRYRLARPLGRGGMGAVWLGEDQLAGRQVAVKELRPPAGLSPEEQDVFRRRALGEARSAARLTHPNAVTLYDVIPASPADDAVYLIMEYVAGATLAQLVAEQGPLSEPRATEIALQLLSVLDAAHALGIVHRDIKPANIMITPAGQVKLTDFGIAHMVGGTRLTGSGVLGTPAYMAPEQLQGFDLTPAVDCWALGVTLYNAVTGRNPFDRNTTVATFHAILMGDLPPAPCGPPLAGVITGLLVRDPAQRMTTERARASLTGAAPPLPPGRPGRPGHVPDAGPGANQAGGCLVSGPRWDRSRHQPGRVAAGPAHGTAAPAPPGRADRRGGGRRGGGRGRDRGDRAARFGRKPVGQQRVIRLGHRNRRAGRDRVVGRHGYSGQHGARQHRARQHSLGQHSLGQHSLGQRPALVQRRHRARRRAAGVPRPVERHDHRQLRDRRAADGRAQAHRRRGQLDRGHVQLHQRPLRVQPAPDQLVGVRS